MSDVVAADPERYTIASRAIVDAPFFPPILRGAFLLALFALGLGGGCWVIRTRVLPFPEVPTVKAKVAHYTAHRDDYDAIFIGSSHIYYQIIPAIFDPLAAAEGLPTHSFNAAVAGMHPPEDACYFEHLMRRPPQHLRWVFLEIGRVDGEIDRAQAGTQRATYWHDWPRLWVEFQRARSADPVSRKLPWITRLQKFCAPYGRLLEHLWLFLQNETNLGRGSLLLDGANGGALTGKVDLEGALGKDLAGWIPTGLPEVLSTSERADYEKQLAERRVRGQRHDPDMPVSQQALETMIAKIATLGATPVLIIPPTTHKSHFFPTAARAGKSIVLDFSDLTRFPELYEPDHRLDADHLNTAGAEVFTRIFAQRWAEEVRRRK